jgi:hypothetical protein
MPGPEDMPGLGATPGVEASAFAKAIDAIISSSRSAAERLEDLNKEIKGIADNGSADDWETAAKAYAKLGRTAKAVDAHSKSLAAQTEELKASSAAELARMSALQRARAAAARGGIETREETVRHHREIGSIQQKAFGRTAADHRAAATALAANGGIFGAARHAITAKGFREAEGGKNPLGPLISGLQELKPELAGLASGMAFALGGFMLLVEMLKTVSADAKDAASSGVELGYNWKTAAAYGAQFGQQATLARMRAGGSMSQSAQMALIQSAYQTMGLGGATGTQYGQAAGGGAGGRNQLRAGLIGFATDVGLAGTYFGMGAAEAVKLASSLGALAHSGLPQTERAFTALMATAQALGVPIEALKAMFGEIAKMSDFGGGANSAKLFAAQTNQIGAALADLAKNGAEGFKNLDSSKLADLGQRLVHSILAVDPTRVLAMTMRPGQSFESGLGSLLGDNQFGLQLSAVRRMSANMSGAPKNTAALGLAMQMGIGGDLRQKEEMGRYVQSLLGSKGMTDAKLAAMLTEKAGNDIQRKFSAASSTGAMIAAGADPMATIANYLADILRMITELAVMIMSSKLLKFGGSDFGAAQADVTREYHDVARARAGDQARAHGGGYGVVAGRHT